MMHDIYTVFWKEVREILRLRKSIRATVVSMVLPVVFIGFFLSASQNGEEWVSGYSSLGIWFMLPYIMITGIIADSFAGERERHTLETLLATPLSETAIMAGKIIATMCYGITLCLCGVAVSLVSVNITSDTGRLLLFTPTVLLAGFTTSLLAALTAASAGTLVSLRASSTRQAQQMLGFAMMLLIVIVVMSRYLIPATVLQSIVSTFEGVSLAGVAWSIAGGVVLFDIALLTIARMRFKRSNMMLD